MQANVTSWFIIIESQKHSSQTTKFYKVIASLPSGIVAKIPGNVLHIHNYDDLKISNRSP